jgi:hypothetical protein
MLQRHAHSHIRFGATRLQRDRLGEGEHRLLRLADREPCLAVIVLIDGRGWIDLHRPSGKADGQIVSSALAAENPQRAQCVGIVRFVCQDLLIG